MGGTFVLPFFYSYVRLNRPMTFKLDSDLSAVNSILGAIGQAPVNSLNGSEQPGPGVSGFMNPEVALCYNLLLETNVDVQSEGWQFNVERGVPFTIKDSTGATPDAYRIAVPTNALNMTISGQQVYRLVKTTDRNGWLYNLTHHTYNWNNWNGGTVHCDVTWVWDFKEIPPVFQRYVTLRASQRAATQLVSNPQLSQMLAEQATMQRAACIQEDCEMGQNTYMGWPTGTTYRPYSPFETLARGPVAGPLGPFANRPNPLTL